MADETKPKGGEPAPATPTPAPAPAAAPAVDATLLAYLKSQLGGPSRPAVGPTPGLDRTIPGGRYKHHGVWVNADGEEINEDGSLKNPGEMVKDPFGRLVPKR